FQAEDGIRDLTVTGVQTCALPISSEATTWKEGLAAPPPAAPAKLCMGSSHARHLPTHGSMPTRRRIRVALWHNIVLCEALLFGEIGRASCRERVEVLVGSWAVKR